MNDNVLNIVNVIVTKPEGVGPSSEGKVPIRRILKFTGSDERDNS